MTLKLAGVHHAQITIPKGDEAAGRRFYCEVLGMTEVEKPEALRNRGGFWVSAGSDILVHIGTEDGVDRAATKAHLAYEVTDLNKWLDHLKKHGIEILDSVPLPGFLRFEFRDPFGNRVEMIQPLPPETR